MERQDRDLAFMLQYENIAWFETEFVIAEHFFTVNEAVNTILSVLEC